MKPATIITNTKRSLFGGHHVHVVDVDAGPQRRQLVNSEYRMPVHYSAGSRAPRAGEQLTVWVDGTTAYAMAPRR